MSAPSWLIWIAFGLLTVGILYVTGIVDDATRLSGAAGLALVVVGVARIFTTREAGVPILLIAGGLFAWLGPDLTPGLTIGKVASFMSGGA